MIDKEEWGKEAIECIAALKSANHAVSGPSMITLSYASLYQAVPPRLF